MGGPGSGRLLRMQSSSQYGCSNLTARLEEDPLPKLMCECWNVSGPCWLLVTYLVHHQVGFFIDCLGVLMDISVADDVLQRVIEETKTKTEVIVFYYLILEVTRHQFCHMPLVTQTNSGTMWKGTT